MALAGVVPVLATFWPAASQELTVRRSSSRQLVQNDDFGPAAQSGVTLKAPLLGQASAAPQAQVRTVQVKGIGTSSDEAQRDAARQAVQQVAGLYIDARRQVESKITDQAISDIVHEKILSYTNAYIAKLDVTNVAKQPDGLIVVDAQVSVAVAPLIKVLQSNNVPTVAFDAATAVGQVEVAAREKQGALDLYADLLKRVSHLFTLSIGTPRVNTTLAAPVDQAWLTVPITYIANEEAIKEWRSKFERIAAKHITARIPFRQFLINAADTQSCAAPILEPMAGLNNTQLTRRFLGDTIPVDQHGVTACFAQDIASSSEAVDCFGRTFLNDAQPSPDICEGQDCLSLSANARQVSMQIELLDGTGKLLQTVPVRFVSFPMLNVQGSSATPPRGATAFFNFCTPNPNPFYFFGQYFAAYGDLIVLPRPGDRIHTYGNFLLPNDVIARTASLRARMVQN